MTRTATKRNFLVAVLFLAATPAWAGDAWKTYKNKVPLADTAIFITEDDQNSAFIGSSIALVDGKSVGSFWLASVYAVRVLPGTHKFTVLAMFDKRGSMLNGPMTYMSQGFEFEVADMKPLHVYVTRWKLADGVVTATIEDLGERPDYKTVLAPKPKF